jgi:protein-arginine kinase activator protein McsA
MLCKQCQEREATVHLTLVVGSAGEIARHDFCEVCYSGVEADRMKLYNAQPNKPLPADVEHITASEYLAACARAASNGVEKPALRHIHEELKRLPKTRQRLAFEMLQLA